MNDWMTLKGKWTRLPNVKICLRRRWTNHYGYKSLIKSLKNSQREERKEFTDLYTERKDLKDTMKLLPVRSVLEIKYQIGQNLK